MERIGRDVERELGRFGPAAGIGELARIWDAAVGAAIARNAVPARIARDGTLHVATSSSSWAFELAHLEPTLRARLAAELGDAAPRRLRFAVGPLPEPASDPAEAAERPPIEPTAADRAVGRELAAGIANEELRARVAAAAAASLARAAADRRF